MLKTEREKLVARESQYLSIGITENGRPHGAIHVPWESTAHAFNMRIPDVYIAPEDLRDDALMEELGSFRVIGCYIWASLEDYGFLSRFPELMDLSIFEGDRIEDLSFLTALDECRMLFLGKARLKDLNVLLDARERRGGLFGCFQCVALYDCAVEEAPDPEQEYGCFSEFLIWGSGDAEDERRWRSVRAGTLRYYGP